METKNLFTAGIFYTAVLALLFTGITIILNAKIDPLKESLNVRIALLEKNQARIEEEQKEMKADIKEIKELLLSGKTALIK